MAASDLVGAWRLVSFESHLDTGEVRHPLGRDAGGLLIYTADGHMAGALWRPDRPRFAENDQQRGTPEEYAAAVGSYVQYTGTYMVDAEMVHHHVEQSLFPNWNGSVLSRRYELDADRLTLRTPPTTFGGTTITGVLEWVRR